MMKSSERGAALIEAALVIPVILLILLGAVYISNQLSAHSLITNIAQEGARFMSKRSGLTAASVTVRYPDINTFPPAGTFMTPTHQHMFRLLQALNSRDGRFMLRDIDLLVEYDPVQDYVRTRVSAEVEPIGLFPQYLLAPLGLSKIVISSTNTQPFLFNPGT